MDQVRCEDLIYFIFFPWLIDPYFMNVLMFCYGTVLNSRVCVCLCAPYMLYSRRACGRRFPWWCLRRLWELPWVWPRPHRWLESVYPTWLSGRFWAPSPGRNFSVWVECCSALWDLQSFLLEFDFSCFLLFFFFYSVKLKFLCGAGKGWWSSCWLTPSAASSPRCCWTWWTTDRWSSLAPCFRAPAAASPCWHLSFCAGRNPEQDQEKIRAGAERARQRATPRGRGGAAHWGRWRV